MVDRVVIAVTDPYGMERQGPVPERAVYAEDLSEVLAGRAEVEEVEFGSPGLEFPALESAELVVGFVDRQVVRGQLGRLLTRSLGPLPRSVDSSRRTRLLGPQPCRATLGRIECS